MHIHTTPYGKCCIGEQSQLFHEAIKELAHAQSQKVPSLTVGLTGGSTPKAFYSWIVEHLASLPQIQWGSIIWSVSDERLVPQESEESNFGNADRGLLSPLGIPNKAKVPWPTALDAAKACATFATNWEDRFGANAAFDCCFLGMGEDGHTASLFPNSPLVKQPSEQTFATIETAKGWRLTLTPKGIKRCSRIIVLVTGAAKATRLKTVLEGSFSPALQPIQLLRDCADQTIWLVDKAAASMLQPLD